MSYKKLEVWQIANKIVIEIHRMTLEDLPKFEMYETGRQIRKSSKSIQSNIVEGYGRRKYQQDYIHFLIIAFGSQQETVDHLETLYSTGSLKREKVYESLKEDLDHLGRKLNRFIEKISLSIKKAKS
jgi:four helix bundle protein